MSGPSPSPGERSAGDATVPADASPEDIVLQAGDQENGPASPPVKREATLGGSLQLDSPGFVSVGKRTGVKIPETPQGITKEWLTQVYQNRGYLRETGHVTSVTVKPLGDGLGVAGDLARVSVELEGAVHFAPRSFVAKFTPQQASLMSSFVLKFQFATEAHWYNDMVEEDEGLSRPAAFYIGAKLRHKRFWKLKPVVCMLVEEMPAPLYSVSGGCGHLPHLEAVVDMLAKLHARWWNAPKQEPIEWVPAPAQDNFGVALNALIFAAKAGTPAMRRCWGDVYAPVLAWAPLIKRRHRHLVRRLFEPPLTVCHGDVHLDNVFFSPSFPGGLKMIDFGNMFFGQGCNDLAFFLGTNLEPEVRRRHEEPLLRRYHAGLRQGGVNTALYPFERCWEDYRLNMWRAYINIAYVTMSRFDVMRKKGTGAFAAEPDEGSRKELATYEARNRRLVAALVDLKFDELLAEGPESCGPCSCLPFCA